MTTPKKWMITTATLLLLGLASVAGSQPDQKAPDAGAAKPPEKTQPQKPRAQHGQQRQRPAQAQGQAQARAPQAARQGRGTARTPQAPAQARAPQTPGQGSAPRAAHRRTAVTNPVQRAAGQQPPTQNPTRSMSRQPGQLGQPGQSGAPVRNRLTPPSRQVNPAPTGSRPVASGTEQRTVWPRFRAQSWTTQHRTWVQRGGYSGFRIPSPQFTLYFGQPHRYHLSSFQVRVVGEYPEFYADGFWFTLLDPVPEEWGDDWYDTDYVTIVQGDDGYYLLDESFPDDMLAISVQAG